MRESILEATRSAIVLGRNPTFEDLKADFKATSTHQIDEQRDPPSIKQFRRIVKTKSHGKVDGVPVDLFSASAVVQVYDALGKTANKVKYAKMDPVEMISLAYKLVQKGRAKVSRETSQASESKVPPQFLSKQSKKKGKGRSVSRETSQAGAGVKNAMAQAVQGRGVRRDPEGDVSYSGTVEQDKLKLFRKASGNQPDIFQVLNPSGGVEGFIEKQPDKGGMKYPWKAFGRTYGGKPGRGKHIGDFPNKNRAIKAVMKGKKQEIAPVIGAIARAAAPAVAGAIAQKVVGKEASSDSKIRKMAYTAAKIVQTKEKGQGKISPLSANREALEPLIRKEVEKGTPSIKIPQKVAREFLK